MSAGVMQAKVSWKMTNVSSGISTPAENVAAVVEGVAHVHAAGGAADDHAELGLVVDLRGEVLGPRGGAAVAGEGVGPEREDGHRRLGAELQLRGVGGVVRADAGHVVERYPAQIDTSQVNGHDHDQRQDRYEYGEFDQALAKTSLARTIASLQSIFLRHVCTTKPAAPVRAEVKRTGPCSTVHRKCLPGGTKVPCRQTRLTSGSGR